MLCAILNAIDATDLLTIEYIDNSSGPSAVDYPA